MPGPARGARHRADPGAAQARCAPASSRCRTAPTPCSPGSPARRGPLLDALERELRRHDRHVRHPARRLGARPGARAPADELPGGRRGRRARSARAATSTCCGAGWRPKVRATSWPRPGRSIERTRHHHRTTSARCRASCPVRGGAHDVNVYPALVDEGDGVRSGCSRPRPSSDPAMLARHPPAAAAHTAAAGRYVQGRPGQPRPSWRCRRNPYRSIAGLLDDCAGAAVDQLVADAGGPAWDERGLRPAARQVRAELVERRSTSCTQVRAVLAAAYDVEAAARRPARRPLLLPALADIRRSSTRWSPRLRHRDRVRRGSPPRPVPARRSSGGSTSCAATLPATRQLTAEVRVVATSTGRAGRAPAGRRADARAARDPLDDRGAAGEPVRAPDAHPLPGLEQADLEGDGRPPSLTCATRPPGSASARRTAPGSRIRHSGEPHRLSRARIGRSDGGRATDDRVRAPRRGPGDRLLLGARAVHRRAVGPVHHHPPVRRQRGAARRRRLTGRTGRARVAR